MKKVLSLILSLILIIFISSCGNKNIDINITNEVNIELGDTYKINYEVDKDYSVSFESSNENIITVDSEGLIRSISVGEATVTLSLDKENIKKTINVKVNKTEPKSLDYGFYKVKNDVTDLSFLEGYPWINTAVEGVLNKIEKPSLKDDYFAHMNYDRLKDLTIPESKKRKGGLLYDTDEFVDGRLKSIINDDNVFLSIKDKYYNGAINEIKSDINSINNLNDTELKNYVSSKELFNSKIGQITILQDKNRLIIEFLNNNDDLGFMTLYNTLCESGLDDLKEIIIKMAELEEIGFVKSPSLIGQFTSFP